MNRLPAFSTILVFVVLSVIGAAVVPLLDVRYSPSEKKTAISVSFYWKDASARLVEREVTSKIEGLAGSVEGIKRIESLSRKGRGSVTVTLKDKNDIQSVRLQLSALIRRIYNRLPDGVSYPELSVAIQGEKRMPVMVYTINSNMSTLQIGEYAKENIVNVLSLIDGVQSVDLRGITPYHTIVVFDPAKLDEWGLSTVEITSAIKTVLSLGEPVGTADNMTLVLKSDMGVEELESLPVSSVNGRVVRLGDVCTVKYAEEQPLSYYRINGLNTINISIVPESDVNTVTLCARIREAMDLLQQDFPENFSALAVSDLSEHIKDELAKIIRRIVISLVILLLFVYVSSRSLKYLAVIAGSLLANILISFIFYALFGVQIHLYSLAGITVSLGIVIDTSIIMISHYSYYKKRNILSAILAALLTSIGSLSVIFLLPEDMQLILTDFAQVIMINLAVAVFISIFLIPSLVDEYNISYRSGNLSVRSVRKMIGFNVLYRKYIEVARRFRWAIPVILVLAFGLPVDNLPDKFNSYKKTLNAVFGGSYRFFKENTRGNIHREIERPTLYIMASLPQGCTIKQLNDVVMVMENYLQQFDAIEMFRTQITGADNATISVSFFKEFENTDKPSIIKSAVISKAEQYGGANWTVSGIDEGGFSNKVLTQGYTNSFKVKGYNLDKLYEYCQASADRISSNLRVKNPVVHGYFGRNEDRSQYEYYIGYDKYLLEGYHVGYSNAYNSLKERIYSINVGTCYRNGIATDIDLVSGNREDFDVWNLENEYLDTGAGMVKFSNLGDIRKRNSGISIYKEDQQYTLSVAFNYLGDDSMAAALIEKETKRLNSSILPVGFKAYAPARNYAENLATGENLILLLIVIAIIYFMCAILFESLLLPLLIIILIPFSFIGVFLSFGITGCSFDQGGYASLIMLSGLVVNAGIYLLCEFRGQKNNIRGYLKAFNRKIIPILLTVISTVLGLIPFLVDGPDEVFWFAFALGTIGGLIFSLLGLVLLTPVWAIPQNKKRG